VRSAVGKAPPAAGARCRRRRTSRGAHRRQPEGRASVPSRQRQLIFVGVVKPWVSPPAGSAAVKLQALEGHDERVQKWLPVRRRAGIKEKAHYLHDLIAHGSQVVEFFKANLPGRCPQEFNCEMQEACNKLCKLELPPLLPMLRKRPDGAEGPVAEKNALFYVMRDWWVRLLHFPGTIPARRLERCGACKELGHRQTNQMCEKYHLYFAKRKADRAAARLAREKSVI